jgi:hypothetical protein
MSVSIGEQRVIYAVADCAPAGLCKCSFVIRKVLEKRGLWNEATELAICNTGYEHAEVGRVYDTIRGLVTRGILVGSRNLILPAGPQYTECGLTDLARTHLSPALPPTDTP